MYLLRFITCNALTPINHREHGTDCECIDCICYFVRSSDLVPAHCSSRPFRALRKAYFCNTKNLADLNGVLACSQWFGGASVSPWLHAASV